MKCDHCDSRLDADPFQYQGHNFCCGCMSVLCSWMLDGGWLENPDLFAYLSHPWVAAARAGKP